jgi:Domain of unknown function (DUF4296)
MRTGAVIVFTLLLMGLASCGNKSGLPPGVLKPAQMEAVLWDIIRVDAYTTDFIKPDTSKNAVEENAKLQLKTFALHKISREDFYKSYEYYKANAGLFKPILDSIIAKAGRNRNEKLIHPSVQ